MTATTQAAAASGISHALARLVCRAAADGGDGLGGIAFSHDVRRGGKGVPEPLRGAGQFILGGHRVSLSARASAARPRAAVDLTVPVLMPSVTAISASDSPA